MQKLGRLEKVELRHIWKTEAGDFTPWLAQPENIKVLSDAIGIDLEVEAQEASVGPFRADILCKDTATDDWVLVENQLEQTDHGHLGQLMTYASGLQAVTIVWIAAKFRNEHRAALDWLNEITDDRFQFFGLETELWRIGDSMAAPKFDVVCSPNDWSKSISNATKGIEAGSGFSATKQLQSEYWTEFLKILGERDSTFKLPKRVNDCRIFFSIGRSYFHLWALMKPQQKRISVLLVLCGQDAKQHFQLLEKDRAQYEVKFGEKLVWELKPGNKESHIGITCQCDPMDRSDWPKQHEWLRDKLVRFRNTFSAPIKQLNAEDFDPEAIEE